ncbi:M23 family metallopeptidase [Patescibacteria group bacterium]|nr:M23 family metallopeptidase [Patescibacteria group bacterium]MBU1890794.1 M23 family metallopeptidase [Patescibacteria group bacterium]
MKCLSWLGPLVLVLILGLIVLPGCSDEKGIESVMEPEVGDSSPLTPDSLWNPGGPVTLDRGYIDYPINPWLPLNGRAFGRYITNRGYHLGDDCVRSPGTPVHAIWNGYVRYARYNHGGWGYLMIVESSINNIPFCTVYGHLGNAMYPGEGHWVSKGQYIGTVGSTSESGQSTPHLHLGIHYGGYGKPTGEYPNWCCGYNWSTSGWFNPTGFMSYF